MAAVDSASSPQVEVVGIGSCTVDYFALISRLIHADEKINVERVEVHAGGVTANNLTQVARLGARAGWFGLLGDDENGRIIREAFERDGMDVSAVVEVKGARSSFTWIPVDRQGERLIYMFPNVTATVTSQQVREHFGGYIRQARHLHSEASQLPLAPVLEAMTIARSAGVKNLFDLDVDPTYFVRDARLGTEAELVQALKLADVLKPCKAAARELTGMNETEQMARKLLTFGPKRVAITLGGDGCLVAEGDRVAHAPSYRVSVVDTTGAGDAFMGGLSFATLQDWDLEQCGRFANACAALCCTRVGARAMAKRAEVDELMKQAN